MQGSMMQRCPACVGRRYVANAKTGEPAVCPLCEGSGSAEPDYVRFPFFYIINPDSGSGVGVSANATVSSALQIDARAAFEWLFLMSTQTSTSFTTKLFDTSGRPYQNLAVNQANQWGTAQRPFPLLAPVIIPGANAINWDVADTSGATNKIQLALQGNELYPIAL